MARVTIATLTVDDTKLAAFKAGVFKKQPVPVNEETGEPEMTEADHLQALGVAYFQRLSDQGTREILAAGQEANVDTGIVR